MSPWGLLQLLRGWKWRTAEVSESQLDVDFSLLTSLAPSSQRLPPLAGVWGPVQQQLLPFSQCFLQLGSSCLTYLFVILVGWDLFLKSYLQVLYHLTEAYPVQPSAYCSPSGPHPPCQHKTSSLSRVVADGRLSELQFLSSWSSFDKYFTFFHRDLFVSVSGAQLLFLLTVMVPLCTLEVSFQHLSPQSLVSLQSLSFLADTLRALGLRGSYLKSCHFKMWARDVLWRNLYCRKLVSACIVSKWPQIHLWHSCTAISCHLLATICANSDIAAISFDWLHQPCQMFTSSCS